MNRKTLEKNLLEFGFELNREGRDWTISKNQRVWAMCPTLADVDDFLERQEIDQWNLEADLATRIS